MFSGKAPQKAPEPDKYREKSLLDLEDMYEQELELQKTRDRKRAFDKQVEARLDLNLATLKSYFNTTPVKKKLDAIIQLQNVKKPKKQNGPKRKPKPRMLNKLAMIETHKLHRVG